MAFYSGTMVKEPSKKSSKLLPILLFLLVAACIGGYLVLTNPLVTSKISLYRCYWDGKVVSTPFKKETRLQAITILPGQDPLAVGKILQEKEVIASADNFLCYVHKIGAGNSIQAGYYELQLPVSIEQVVPLLQNSRIPTLKVTLPEGLRMDEIAQRVDTAMGAENTIKKFSKEEFLQLATDKANLETLSYTKGKSSAEGFLFPDTYEVPKDATAKDIYDLLTKTFIRKIAEGTSIDSSTALTPYQVVTLASILEKEAGKSYEEKRTVAGILLKRMKNNWLLQVDATFLYEKKDWKAPIYAEDKLSNSLYNTYKRMGLPPTPICNPGLESIKAVLEPIESPYWFYLHGTDGKIRYGKTNAEHLQNITLYLR